METYDIIMIVVLAGATMLGALKGFAWQLASIASIVISYAVAHKYRVPFSQSIQAEPPWNRFFAMLILYIGTSLVIWVVFRMVRGSIDRLKLKEFDRQVGALFGLAKGGLYCVLITLFAVTLMGDQVRSTIVQSKSGNYIANVLHQSESVIPPEIKEVVLPYLEHFDQQFKDSLDSDRSFHWPWMASQPTKTSNPSSFPSDSITKKSSTPWQAPQTISNPTSADDGFSFTPENSNSSRASTGHAAFSNPTNPGTTQRAQHATGQGFQR